MGASASAARVQAAVRDQTSRCEELAARLASAAAAQGGAAQQRDDSASALADAQEAHDAVATDGAAAAAAETQVRAAAAAPAPDHPSPLLAWLQSDLHHATASMPGEAILHAGDLPAPSWCTTFTSRCLPQHVRCSAQHASGGADVLSKISTCGGAHSEYLSIGIRGTAVVSGDGAVAGPASRRGCCGGPPGSTEAPGRTCCRRRWHRCDALTSAAAPKDLIQRLCAIASSAPTPPLPYLPVFSELFSDGSAEPLRGTITQSRWRAGLTRLLSESAADALMPP